MNAVWPLRSALNIRRCILKKMSRRHSCANGHVQVRTSASAVLARGCQLFFLRVYDVSLQVKSFKGLCRAKGSQDFQVIIKSAEGMVEARQENGSEERERETKREEKDRQERQNRCFMDQLVYPTPSNKLVYPSENPSNNQPTIRPSQKF